MGACEAEGGNENNETESRATYTTGGRCSWSTYLPATGPRQACPDCTSHLTTGPRQACLDCASHLTTGPRQAWPDCISGPATDARHQEAIVRIINKLIVIKTH
jgi:predicted amidophosphoribosyltransferase